MNLFLSLHSAWTIGRIRAVSARFPFGRFTQPPLSDPEGAPFEQYRAQTQPYLKKEASREPAKH